MSIKFSLRDEQVRRNLIDYINKQPVNADFPLVVNYADPAIAGCRAVLPPAG